MGLIHKWRYLRRSESFECSPVKTVARLVVWRIRSALHMSTIIRLHDWRVRFYVAPQWRGMAKLVYTFREKYEPELHWVAERLQPGQVMVDVGACHGIYTILAASRVGPTGTVIALEPAERSFGILQKNLELNGLTNVLAVRMAAADKEGVATLYHDPDSSRNSLDPARARPRASEPVKTTSVDALVRWHSIARVDLVKIDVEGCESRVLLGAIETLTRWRPAVLFELNLAADEGLSSSVVTPAELLKELGYSFFLVRSGRLQRIWEMPHGGNVLALCE